MNILTIYFPYYNQINALKFLLDHYSNFKEEVRKKIIIFIVDDGSLEEASNYVNDKHLLKLNIILYRININVPWNQGEANNLAFSKINTKYVLRTDIDHFINEKNLNKLLNNIINLDLDKNFYKFKRRTNYNEKLKSHKNTFLISKKNYMKVKGFNESLCGNYGDDFDFIPRIKKIIKEINLKNIEMLVNPSNGTNGLIRDSTINKEKLQDKNLPHLFLRNKEHYILQIESYIKKK